MTVQQPDPVLLAIGDINVTQNWVSTPNGYAPLRGSQWTVIDGSITRTVIPAYAIILAIVFALACLLGLLFLLIKEERTSGYVTITVRSGNLLHSAQIPITDPHQVAGWRAAVSRAQLMAQA